MPETQVLLEIGGPEPPTGCVTWCSLWECLSESWGWDWRLYDQQLARDNRLATSSLSVCYRITGPAAGAHGNYGSHWWWWKWLPHMNGSSPTPSSSSSHWCQRTVCRCLPSLGLVPGDLGSDHPSWNSFSSALSTTAQGPQTWTGRDGSPGLGALRQCPACAWLVGCLLAPCLCPEPWERDRNECMGPSLVSTLAWRQQS